MIAQDIAAKEVVKELQKHHHKALYVGGCVRDMLLELKLNDFDIATSAIPEEISKIFPKTIPVGIQFGIIVVVHHGYNFEVATFREDKDYVDGRHPSGVIKSTMEQDVKRRDFTINGLYYDPIKHELIDLIDGKKDLKSKLIRAIGDPRKRFEEDRLRMIRAARYASVLNFQIEPSTKQAILDMAFDVCKGVSIERIYQELDKIHAKDCIYKGLMLLDELCLLNQLLPMLNDMPPAIKQERIKKLKSLNHDVPLILALCILLKIDDQIKLESLVKFLKIAKENFKIGQLFLQLNNHKKLSNLELASLLACPYSEVLLQAQSAIEHDAESFIKSMNLKKSQLSPVIKSIQEKNPIITSHDLMGLGIEKGPKISDYMHKSMKYFADHPDLTKQKILEMIKLELMSQQ